MVYGEVIQSPQVKYAELLVSLLPENLNCIYFVNSGSEAVEGAIKLTRRHTGKTEVVYFSNAYHGSTYGALSVQGSDLFRSAFGPLLPDTVRAGFNDRSVAGMISEKTAAVIVEPIQAEAGVILPDPGFLQLLRKRCDETGALLIFDECQTGFGRTGTMFAMERYAVVPDILVLAKALGGGMPLGSFIASGNIMKSLSFNPALGHITTFGGHPVCCAAGMASLQTLMDEELISGVVSKGQRFRSRLRHDLITEVRGEGLLLAVRLGDAGMARYVVSNAPRYGFVTDYFLFCPDSFRIAPPLSITNDEIDEACNMIIQLLDEAVKA
jgi:acetylornithine/succinyldiaminopimelate/putrescine aminotransferase